MERDTHETKSKGLRYSEGPHDTGKHGRRLGAPWWSRWVCDDDRTRYIPDDPGQTGWRHGETNTPWLGRSDAKGGPCCHGGSAPALDAPTGVHSLQHEHGACVGVQGWYRAMTSILQLDPPIPMKTTKGDGYAHVLIDYGPEYVLQWVVFIDGTGECWTVPNPEVRIGSNWSLGRRDHVGENPNSGVPVFYAKRGAGGDGNSKHLHDEGKRPQGRVPEAIAPGQRPDGGAQDAPVRNTSCRYEHVHTLECIGTDHGPWPVHPRPDHRLDPSSGARRKV